MGKEEIREQIRQWLLEETKQQSWIIKFNDADPAYDWTFQIVNNQNVMNCIICMEKDIDRINIMNELTFLKPDKISYKLTAEKGKYWIDLRINLMQLGVDIQAIPDVEKRK